MLHSNSRRAIAPAILAGVVGLTLLLSACAPNGSTTTAPEPAPIATAAAPTPTPTVHVAERVVFEGSVAYDDLAAVADAGDIPVILLPAVLDASVTITGAPAKPWTESLLQVSFADDGTVLIRPQSRYDAFKTPKDFVGESSGTLGFDEFLVDIEGVQP